MLRVNSLGDVYTLHVTGEIDHAEMVEIRNAIADLIREGHANVVLSLREVRHVNYLSIGVLVERLKRLRICGGDLKLVGASGYLRNIFTTVGAWEFFDAFDSVEEALSSFSEHQEFGASLSGGRW